MKICEHTNDRYISDSNAALIIAVRNRLDAEIAVNTIVAFSNNRPGRWIIIPFCKKDMDLIAPYGYLGFVCEDDGFPASVGAKDSLDSFVNDSDLLGKYWDCSNPK